jgi:hypothetical protein
MLTKRRMSEKKLNELDQEENRRREWIRKQNLDLNSNDHKAEMIRQQKFEEEREEILQAQLEVVTKT